MLNIPVLDFFLSVVFIFLLYTMLCSWIVEAVSRILNWRGKFLQKKLRSLLNSESHPDFYEKVMAHPLLNPMSKSLDKPPSNIDPDLFSKAITDTIETSLNNGASSLPQSIKAIQDQSKGDESIFRNGVRDWFNVYMDRVALWYKQELRWKLFVTGFLIALVMNVDGVRVLKTMWTDSQLRSATASMAYQFESTNDSLSMAIPTLMVDRSASFPVGWMSEIEAHTKSMEYRDLSIGDRINESLMYWLGGGDTFIYKLIGFFLSGFVVTLGAPFWFDLLRKLTSIGRKST